MAEQNNTLTVIRQGDQYKIPMTVMNDGTVMTNTNCDGMRILLGKYLAVWPNGELTYDDATEMWLFPLTQQMSYGMHGGKIYASAQYKINDKYITSGNTEIIVEKTNFPGEW